MCRVSALRVRAGVRINEPSNLLLSMPYMRGVEKNHGRYL